MKNTVTGRQQGIKAIVTIGSQNQEVEERKRMARLTDEDEQGNWMLKTLPLESIHEGKYITKEVWEKLYGALWKLMEYEDTGLTPEQIHEMDKLYQEKCREVAELREKADGILLMLNDDGVAEVYDDTYDITIHCESKEEQDKCVELLNSKKWIPLEERLPVNDDYVLLSFENYSFPMIGRYVENKEGGAWYLGDCVDEDTCVANDLFVNAWMPLPEPYKVK